MGKKTTWDLYFLTIVGWSLHPGYQRNPESKLTLDEAAHMADEMLRVREEKWQSGSKLSKARTTGTTHNGAQEKPTNEP